MKKQNDLIFVWLAITLLAFAFLYGLFNDSENMPWKLSRRIDKIDSDDKELIIVIKELQRRKTVEELQDKIMPSCMIKGDRKHASTIKR